SFIHSTRNKCRDGRIRVRNIRALVGVFFFQAEDGIRVRNVTGVQTCALPISNAWVPHQFNNMANPEIHRKTTAKEILKDSPKGFDYLITGVGTGGHITGVGQVLKEIGRASCRERVEGGAVVEPDEELTTAPDL